MYTLSVLFLLMTIPAMIYGGYRWIRYRKKETRRLKGKHIFFLSLILFFLLSMYISTFPEAKQQTQEEHQQEISKRSRALASSKAAKRSKAVASSKAAADAQAAAASKAAADAQAAAANQQTNTSGYFRDRNGRWHRPNGKFASKQEILNAGLSW